MKTLLALSGFPFLLYPLVAEQTLLLADPGFEKTAEGNLITGTTAEGWEVQRTGREKIQDQRSLLYVSLLPNQVPRRTNLLVDDFLLTEMPGDTGTSTPDPNPLKDGGFDEGDDGKPAPPWFFANMGGAKIAGTVVAGDGQRFFRMAMNVQTSNLESAQLWQHLSLTEGIPYGISCRMRWDNRGGRKDGAIVNFGIYHEASNTWYGPVDQVLEPSDDWVTYHFTHIPPHDGTWKIYAQLNGWGNFGKDLTVSFDDFVCRPIDPELKTTP